MAKRTRKQNLTAEQEDVERQREEFAAAERGTGDQPPAVHGRMHHVASPADRLASGDQAGPNQRAMRVEAIKTGFYGDVLRDVGDVFEISAAHFTETWMKPAAEDAPLTQRQPDQRKTARQSYQR